MFTQCLYVFYAQCDVAATFASETVDYNENKMVQYSVKLK